MFSLYNESNKDKHTTEGAEVNGQTARDGMQNMVASPLSPGCVADPGTRHVVTFDGARDLLSSTLTLSCAGSMTTCGCVDVTGAIAGPESSGVGCGTAIFEFQNTSTSAQFKPSDCLVQATVTLEAIREGGETMVSGGGVAVFSNGGQYVLSSIVEAHVKVESAAEVICAEWSTELVGGVNVTSGGVLWIAGALYTTEVLTTS